MFFVTFYLISPRQLFFDPGLSLDPSFEVALNYCFENGFVFGKEVVFTYGPLSFLFLKICSTNFQIILNILVNLGLTIALSYFLSRYVYYSFKRKDYVFTLFLLVMFLMLPLVQKDIMFSLLLLYFILTREIKIAGKYGYLYAIAVIIPLAFFVKVNVGVFILLHYVLLLTFLVTTRVLPVRKHYTLIPFVLCIGLILFLSRILHVDIAGYINNSLAIIKDYNEAQQIAPSGMSVYSLLAFMCVAGAGLFFVVKEINRKNYLTVLFLTANVFSMIYVIYKQGYVRADASHVMLLFIFPFYFILSSFNPAGGFITRTRYKAVLLSVGLIMVSSMQLSSSLPSSLSYKDKLYPPFYTMFRDVKERHAGAVARNKKRRVLPDRFISRIGNSTVDIIPWEQSFLIYNELNYRPRPVFQSYIAASPYLDNLNASFMAGERAPRFLLYSTHSIDNRYPFWDEMSTKMVMAERYRVIDTATFEKKQYKKFYTAEENPRMLLLEKIERAGEYNMKLAFQQEYSTPFPASCEIEIPPTESLLFLRLDLHKTMAGKLRSFLYQPSLINFFLKVNNEWGGRRYRVSPYMLAEGVLINKFLSNTSEAELFFRGKTEELQRIEAIRFELESVSRYVNMPSEVYFKEYKVVTSSDSGVGR